jgi:hypothetical protein
MLTTETLTLRTLTVKTLTTNPLTTQPLAASLPLYIWLASLQSSRMGKVLTEP